MSLTAQNIKRSMKDYNEILCLYRSSFPETEQFPVWLLRLMSFRKNVHPLAFYDGDTFCGFAYFLVNETTVFILFLAVNSKLRSKSYGSQIIAWIKQNYPGRAIFLDVEKPDAAAANHLEREKRVAFYRRNGILDTNRFFTYDDVTYEILCTDPAFTEEDYNENLTSYFRVFKRRKNR